ncbi:Release factor glutamine methyltransferase [bacterium HR09]|nr:Release factor glutamine methyltransferase [bacterium HR09]
MTIAELLAEARALLKPREGMLFPEREARAFLTWLLGKDEAFVLAHPEQQVPEALVIRFREMVARRGKGEPFHLIVGFCPFFGREFAVAPGVLIPRPETELLLSAVLRLPLPPRPRVLDVGTGSGVLAVSLKCELPQATVVASDVSWQALHLARKNAEKHQVTIGLVLAHLASAFRGAFDLVVANLPYLPEGMRHRLPPELAFEDPRALFAGEDGLTLLQPLVHDLPRLLKDGGFAALELGEGQASRLISSFAPQLEPHDVVYDLRGVERVLLLRKKQC